MALSDDQRALLRLLVGGDTEEQIAEVLGTSPSEVRERADRAVSELEASGEDPELASAARERLDALGQPEATPAPATEGTAASGRGGLPRAAWIAIGAALAALVIALVVVQVGGDSGDSGSAPPSDQEDVIPVKLEPVGDSGASGTATIVRVVDRPAIDVDVSGLAPSGPGETYVLWLLGSGRKGLPIAFRNVGKDGRFVGRTQVPTAAAGLLPNVDFIDISRAREAEVAPAINQAAENNTLPDHLGTSVVRGRLPG